MKDLVTAAVIGLMFFVCIYLARGCSPSNARPTAYGAELQACTESSKTLAESIVCENGVRTRYGRPLRDASVE